MSKPDFTHFLLEGVGHFNRREFWEAHESWETIWLAAETDLEQFLQGLIQIAAAYHHVQRGTFRGAIRLFESGLRRLSAFPANYCGIDRSAAEAAAKRDRERLLTSGQQPFDAQTYPELILLQPEQIAPPVVQW